MKVTLYILLFSLYLHVGFAQSFEFSVNSKDTINYTGVNGRREGKWILMGKHMPKTCYAFNQVVQTGNYSNNMKQGLWEEYSCGGLLKSQQVYINGKVNGATTLYQENGKISAKGTFKIDHWVDELELFDTGGRLLYRITFDGEGNRKSGLYFRDQKEGRNSAAISLRSY